MCPPLVENPFHRQKSVDPPVDVGTPMASIILPFGKKLSGVGGHHDSHPRILIEHSLDESGMIIMMMG